MDDNDESVAMELENYDVINDDFVREFHFNQLSLGEVDAIKLDATFKVLKITNCSTTRDLIAELTQEDYGSALQKSTHFFVISAEVLENGTQFTNIELETLGSLVGNKRPLIVQLKSTFDPGKSFIYYKEENSTNFQEIPFVALKPITSETVLTRIVAATNCNFLLMLRALKSDFCGFYNDDILDVKLNRGQERHFLNVNFGNSSLCLRFLKLHQEKSSDEYWISEVASSLKKKNGVNSFLASLDLSFQVDGEIKLTEEQRNVLMKTDIRGYSLMLFAVEIENTETVKYLAKYGGFDLNNAANFAWKKQSLDCWIELIKLDARFPTDFKLESSNLSPTSRQKLEEIVEEREAFHGDIKSGFDEKVTKFIKKHDRLKKVYSTINKSALTVALESSQFYIFSLLRFEGFSKDDHFFIQAWDKLNYSDRSKITEANKNFFPSFEANYLVEILSKTRLSFDSRHQKNENFAMIRQMYDELNRIFEIRPILEAIACADQLEIVFDFTQDWVDDMDPTKAPGTRGTSYHKLGHIYIGAKGEHYDVLGTLIHEMTHYVMQLVYENNCAPYHKNLDKKDAAKKRFDEIVEKCFSFDHSAFEALSGPIISRVFENYNSRERWPAELIVRIPQILAQYSNIDSNESTKIILLKQFFPDLFHYYFEKTTKDVNLYAKNAEQKCLIKEINSTTSLLCMIQSESLNYSTNQTITQCSANKFNIIASNASIMTLMTIFGSLTNGESSHMFLTVESIFNNKIGNKIKTLFESPVKPRIFIDCSNKFSTQEKNLCNFLLPLNDRNRITIVITHKELVAVKRNFGLENIEVKTINHTWNELNDDHREELMRNEMNFQGYPIKLNQLLDKSSEIMQFFALNDVFDYNNSNIGEPIKSPNYDFYIIRTFQVKMTEIGDDESETKKEYFVKKTFEEMLKLGSDRKSMIISDVAGTGKTSILNSFAKALKEENPTRWVSLIDLKLHVGAFDVKVKSSSTERFENFLISTVFLNQNVFDQKLFLDLYLKGKTIILLDGFDEVSPLYKDLILSAVNTFDATSENQLWITTRSHLEKDLESRLKQNACNISQLTKEDMIEFLKDSWKALASDETTSRRIEESAKSLVEKLSGISYSVQSSIGAPIMVSMLAKIYEAKATSGIEIENFISLNFFSIYEQYVDLFFKVWMEKGELYIADQREINQNEEITLQFVHQIIAIKYIFGDVSLSFSLDLDQDDWSLEKLSRINIMKDKLQFHHETFAEFFVARFIVNNLLARRGKTCDAVALLVKVLERKLDYKIVRLFIDSALSNERKPDQSHETLLAQLFINNQLLDNNCLILFNVLSDSFEHLSNFFLMLVKRSQLNIIKLVMDCENREALNILHTVLRHGSVATVTQTFEVLSLINLDDQKVYFERCSRNEENVFLCAAQNKHEGVLSTLQKFVVQKLFIGEAEIKAFLIHRGRGKKNILHYVVMQDNTEVLQEIFGILKRHLVELEIKNMLLEQSRSNENCLHRTIKQNSKSFVEAFFTTFVASFDPDEQKNILRSRGNDGKNILHTAAQNSNSHDVLPILLDYLKRHFSSWDINQLLQQKDSKDENIFKYVAQNPERIDLLLLIEAIREFLSDSEIRTLIIEEDENGCNSLFRAIVDRTSFKVDAAKQLLNEHELKNFYSNNKTIFLQAADIIKLPYIIKSAFENAIQFAENTFSEAEIKELLLHKHERSKLAILHVAVKSASSEIIKPILITLKKYLTSDELIILANERDASGDNFFHYAARSSDILEFSVFCRFVSSLFDENEQKPLQKDFLSQCGSNNETLFLCTASNLDNEDVQRALLDLYIKSCDNDEIKFLLQKTNSRGDNVLHRHCSWSNGSSLNHLVVNILSVYLSIVELKAFFYQKNKRGNNCLLEAVNEKNGDVCDHLCRSTKTIFEVKEELKAFFAESGENGENIFSCAAASRNQFIWKSVFPILESHLRNAQDESESVFSKTEIKQMLLQTNAEQCHILQIVTDVKCDSNKIIQTLNFLNKYLEILELKDLLGDKTPSGDSCFHQVIAHVNKEDIEMLCSNVLCLMDENERKALLSSCNQSGYNIFHVAAAVNTRKDLVKTLNVLIKFMENIFDEKEIKELLKGKCKKNFNILHFFNEGNSNSLFSRLINSYELIGEHLGSVELKALINEENAQGDNCLHHALTFCSETDVESLCDFLRNLFDEKEQKVFFRKCGNNDQNIFLCAAVNKSISRYNSGVLGTVYKFAELIYNKDEVKLMMKHSNLDDLNIIMIEINQQRDDDEEDDDEDNYETEHPKNMFEILEQCLSAPGEMRMFLLESNSRGNNCLLHASKIATRSMLHLIFQSVNKHLTIDDKKVLYSSCDFDGNDVFLCAAFNDKNRRVFETLFHEFHQVFTREEMRKILHKKNNLGLSTFHALFSNCNGSILNDFYEFFKKFFNANEIRDMILEQSGSKYNFLQLTVLCCKYRRREMQSKRIFEEMYDLFRKDGILSIHDFQSLLKRKDEDGKTTLKLALGVEYNEFGVYKSIWNIIRKVFGQEGQREQLIQLSSEELNLILDLENEF